MKLVEASRLRNGSLSSSVLPFGSRGMFRSAGPHEARPAAASLPQAQTHQTAANHTVSTQNNRSLHNPPQRFNDTQNFSVQKVSTRQFIFSNQSARQRHRRQRTIQQRQPPILIESSEVVANVAASCGATLRGFATDVPGEGRN